ncbi:MAG TPA: hypothetical protein VFA49_05060 [Chloroflexota bacterium]|nr:hypothetical protein [Chloroflexota bacterium]
MLVANEAPDPVPGAGDPGPGAALIDLQLAIVTFVEAGVRAGTPPHPSKLPQLPAILGTGVSGVVAGVGPHVDAGPVGRRVVTSLDKRLLRVSNGA